MKRETGNNGGPPVHARLMRGFSLSLSADRINNNGIMSLPLAHAVVIARKKNIKLPAWLFLI